MKIISSAKGDNIRITCQCCGCVYEIESKDDFNIRYVYKPIGHGFEDYSIKIPEYSVDCPDCGVKVYIGIDPHDTDYVYCSALCSVITARKDWAKRYKVEPIKV